MTNSITFTQWISLQLGALNVTKLELSKSTGIPYRTISQSNHCKPHLDNMIIICEYINGLKSGDQNDFNALICDAILSCCVHYQFAIQKLKTKETT